jgi:hypothetical protein
MHSAAVGERRSSGVRALPQRNLVVPAYGARPGVSSRILTFVAWVGRRDVSLENRRATLSTDLPDH